MKLASVELIKNIAPHPNADRISIAEVLGFQCIIPKDTYSIGQKIVFIAPDTVLPENTWAGFYLTKNKTRVKSQKIRGIWSVGIVESLERLGVPFDTEVGAEISSLIGVYRYELPVPQNLDAKGTLPFGIFKTDESNYQSIDNLPFSQEVIVTLKKDGSSSSFYCKLDGEKVYTGVTSRSMDLKLESFNPWTEADKKFNVLEKLKKYCLKHQTSLCLRGEITGKNLNDSSVNPDSKGPLRLSIYNLLNLNSLHYKSFDKCVELCKELDIPSVPILERAILTPELIKKYSEDLESIDGKPFEGCVFKESNGNSFKVLNKFYDSKK